MTFPCLICYYVFCSHPYWQLYSLPPSWSAVYHIQKLSMPLLACATGWPLQSIISLLFSQRAHGRMANSGWTSLFLQPIKAPNTIQWNQERRSKDVQTLILPQRTAASLLHSYLFIFVLCCCPLCNSYLYSVAASLWCVALNETTVYSWTTHLFLVGRRIIFRKG